MKIFSKRAKTGVHWSLKKDFRRSTEYLKTTDIGSQSHKDALMAISMNTDIQNAHRDSIGKWIQVLSTAAVSVGMTFVIIYKDQVGELISRGASTWQQRHHRP